MKSSLILVLFLLLIACGGADEDSTIDVTQQTGSVSPVDSVTAEWLEFLQSSDEGLWEGSAEHLVSYGYSSNLTDPEALDPIVYKPYALCTSGDTVFVTDGATQEIVALNSAGELLWKVGGEGEAPGHFTRISTLAVYRIKTIGFYAPVTLLRYQRRSDYTAVNACRGQCPVQRISSRTSFVATSNAICGAYLSKLLNQNN